MKLLIILLFCGVIVWCLVSARRPKNKKSTGNEDLSRRYNDFRPPPQVLTATEDESDFLEEVALVRKAISEAKYIEFMYCKPTETIYKKRVVRPTQILEVDHEYDFGSTLCVRGYCNLRKAERTFAFKRMQELRIQ